MRRARHWLSVALALVLGVGVARAQEMTSPHGTDLKEACSTCHRPDAWTPVKISSSFRHAPKRFPLDGAHAQTACTTCHKRLDFKEAPAKCASCHEDTHHGELGTDCGRCHTPRSFIDPEPMRRAHDQTRFPLRGAHAVASCEACHVPTQPGQMEFVNRPTTCFGCHAKDYQSVRSPDHQASGFPQDCTACHTQVTWSTATFDHNATAFPLTGAHLATSCQDCHADRVYKGKPTDCYGCHRTNYDATKDPPHAASGFPTACLTCHNTTDWSGTPFDHSTTAFALTGAHLAATCADCHGDGVYKGKATDCYACHRTDYDNSAEPKHAAAGFATTCATCHTTANWTGATFDHATTGWPLTGQHIGAACSACHGDNVYGGKATDCYSCHRTEYDNATSPNHVASSFPNTCTTCHSTAGWTGASFDHNATGFPLTGAHLAATCLDCHGDGVYAGKSTACYSCHQANYNATTNPPHAASGFPNTCETCHTSTNWTSAVFDHSATAFPLTGAHLAASCLDCHGDGVYKGKSTDCYACHAPAYNATTTPPHAASSIGTACANCHNTTQWPGAAYDHSTTAFPLTGAHLAATCARCHGDGVWKGKPTDCYSCHQADYNGTTNPNHAAAVFPTTCASCHTTTQWAGATFDHDSKYFPIYSGHHAGTWSSCATCHTSPSNFAVFTCLVCHEHSQSSMDSHHSGVSGYAYDSQKCYACHPRGRAG